MVLIKRWKLKTHLLGHLDTAGVRNCVSSDLFTESTDQLTEREPSEQPAVEKLKSKIEHVESKKKKTVNKKNFRVELNDSVNESF